MPGTANGIGPTETEIHRFLATIGESSKRNLGGGGVQLVGQCGIGLLSCFMVSDEIVVVTRSARPAQLARHFGGLPPYPIRLKSGRAIEGSGGRLSP